MNLQRQQHQQNRAPALSQLPHLFVIWCAVHSFRAASQFRSPTLTKVAGLERTEAAPLDKSSFPSPWPSLCPSLSSVPLLPSLPPSAVSSLPSAAADVGACGALPPAALLAAALPPTSATLEAVTHQSDSLGVSLKKRSIRQSSKGAKCSLSHDTMSPRAAFAAGLSVPTNPRSWSCGGRALLPQQTQCQGQPHVEKQTKEQKSRCKRHLEQPGLASNC